MDSVETTGSPTGLNPAGVSRMGRWTPRASRSLGVGLLLVAMAATIVALTRQVRTLQPQADELRRRVYFPVVGHSVPTVRLATISGDSVTIGETAPGRQQVLFFFSASCRHCEAVLPTWRALADELRGDAASRFDIIGVSYSGDDSTRAYARSHALPFPVVRMSDIKTRRLFRVKGVPMTLVTDYQGQLTFVHPGRFATLASIDSLRMVTLRRAPLDTAQRLADRRP